MAAEWVVLGAGSILPRAGYGCAGYALVPEPGGPITLVDCGPGTLRSMGEAGLELALVERVLITHFHADHCLDLFALGFALRNPAFDEAGPVEIVGPVGLAALLRSGADRLGSWVRGGRMEATEVAPGREGTVELVRGGLRFSAVPTGHTPEALAWRADLPTGASVAFSGDTGETAAVADLASGVGLFTLECSHPDGAGVPGHLTPSQAGRLAARARCARLLLTHFYPGTDPERCRRSAGEAFDGPVEVARDRARFALDA